MLSPCFSYDGNVSNTRVLCPPFESTGTIRGGAMMSMARDCDRVWVQWQKKKKKKNIRSRSISSVYRRLALGRPVVALFSYYLKFFRCQWLVIRAYNDRLNGSRLSARTFINSRAGLFYYFHDTLRKLYNRACTIKRLITRICDKKIIVY